MEKWFVMNKRADFGEIGRQYGIDPVIARLIRNRDIVGTDAIDRYLHPSLDRMYDPFTMKDIRLAADILLEKISSKKKIRIISDYDVDGVISNYVLLKGLRQVGALVDYEIPDRIADGYGINENLIQKAYDAGVDTIVTCDNGIAAIDQIGYAKDLGMTVVVTDHHDIPFIEEDGEKKYLMSRADAIVNPKQADCNYPFKNLCGAAVAYKLIEVLYQLSGMKAEKAHELIEYVSIATVCDVVDLLDENRIIVKKGLEMLNHTSNLGLIELLKANGLEDKKLAAYHLGFVIGPCINATGRLDSAKKSLSLLLTDDKDQAALNANELKSLNDQRKDMTLQGFIEAINLVETTDIMEDKVLVIYLPDCHESLAGIIAGRVREKYNKPVFVITKTLEGLKGSGRSIEAYNMFEEISKCKELLTKFGGHPMAAGLSMENDSLIPFRRKLNQITNLSNEDLAAKISIDIPMPLDYITKELIDQLDLLEPFGKANTKPVFAEKNINIISGRILGKNQNVIKLKVQNQAGCLLDAMFFGNVDDFNAYFCEKFGQGEMDLLYQGRMNKVNMDCTYYPSINEYNGSKTIQVIIMNYK